MAETTDGTIKSRATFIKDEAHIFFDNCAEKKQDTPENRYIFNEFLTKFYDITFAYCRSLLTRNEKILLSNVRSGFKEVMENDDKNTETLSKEINELKDILRTQKTINAPETVRTIYYNISAYIWAGKGKDIEFLIPLIKDKKIRLAVRRISKSPSGLFFMPKTAERSVYVFHIWQQPGL